MAFTEGSEEGVLNGTSYVVLLQSPGAGERRITKSIIILNRDTDDVTLEVFVNEDGARRQLCRPTIATYQSFIWDTSIVLNSTTKQIDARLLAAVAVSEPDFVTTYAVIS